MRFFIRERIFKISNNYLLPKLYNSFKFEKTDIIFNDNIIEYIVKQNHVVRITFFKRKKHTIKVEERFPIHNNYEYMNLIKCRQNIIY